jgi:hypothetical protein
MSIIRAVIIATVLSVAIVNPIISFYVDDTSTSCVEVDIYTGDCD